VRLIKSTGIMAALAAGTVLASAAPASAGTVPYQNWTQMAGNVAGIKFNPTGDKFTIWDNIHGDGHPAYGWVSYRNGTRSCPSPSSAYTVLPRESWNGAHTQSFNVREHTQVCFYVTYSGRNGTSPVVRYRTS
jgi:hypothetical protein